MAKSSIAAIVLNWNDADLLPHSIGSLLVQTRPCDIIVVDNGSVDNSREVITSFGDNIVPLWNQENKGFAGGVNTGIRYAIEQGYEYIALLNNDAVADKNWIKHLFAACSSTKRIGAATSTMLHANDDTYDSTGEFYTVWGLPYPRGRDEPAKGQYDKEAQIMGASGGASMFRASMFKDVGLFDEDFFAYYEDVDLGLRAHTRGWRMVFAPKAKVLHATGTTSGRVKNFGTLQGLKNQPLLLIKNIPSPLFWRILPRFLLAHVLFTCRALSRGQITTVLKVWFILLLLIPKKWLDRLAIQRSRGTSAQDDIKHLLVYDLPHNAHLLRKFRSLIRKVFPKFI